MNVAGRFKTERHLIAMLKPSLDGGTIPARFRVAAIVGSRVPCNFSDPSERESLSMVSPASLLRHPRRRWSSKDKFMTCSRIALIALSPLGALRVVRSCRCDPGWRELRAALLRTSGFREENRRSRPRPKSRRRPRTRPLRATPSLWRRCEEGARPRTPTRADCFRRAELTCTVCHPSQTRWNIGPPLDAIGSGQPLDFIIAPRSSRSASQGNLEASIREVGLIAIGYIAQRTAEGPTLRDPRAAPRRASPPRISPSSKTRLPHAPGLVIASVAKTFATSSAT